MKPIRVDGPSGPSKDIGKVCVGESAIQDLHLVFYLSVTAHVDE